MLYKIAKQFFSTLTIEPALQQIFQVILGASDDAIHIPDYRRRSPCPLSIKAGTFHAIHAGAPLVNLLQANVDVRFGVRDDGTTCIPTDKTTRAVVGGFDTLWVALHRGWRQVAFHA